MVDVESSIRNANGGGGRLQLNHQQGLEKHLGTEAKSDSLCTHFLGCLVS